MSAQTTLTMADGRGIDLLAVKAADIIFPTLAEHLAKENRFNGATPGITYSVAQHLCLGADAMIYAGATDEETAYFLLHDTQEGLWKDDPTPKKIAIATRIAERCGVLSSDILNVLDSIVDEHDTAIHQAAGLPWPPKPEIARIVKLYDLIMFVTEWRDLMRDILHPNWAPYSGIRPLADVIVPWNWSKSANEYLIRLSRYLPALRKRAA